MSILKTCASRSCIRVVIRARPLFAGEDASVYVSERGQIEIPSTSGITDSAVKNSRGSAGTREKSSVKTFNFTDVYGPDASQDVIFKDIVAPVVDDVLKGYNCTIFVYGQTGTGKTYTMEGLHREGGGLEPTQIGMIPRSIHRIFQVLNEACPVQASINKAAKPVYQQLVKQPSQVTLIPPQNNQITSPVTRRATHVQFSVKGTTKGNHGRATTPVSYSTPSHLLNNETNSSSSLSSSILQTPYAHLQRSITPTPATNTGLNHISNSLYNSLANLANSSELSETVDVSMFQLNGGNPITSFNVSISNVEVYKEELFDLLSQNFTSGLTSNNLVNQSTTSSFAPSTQNSINALNSAGKKSLTIRENSNKEVIVVGLEEHPVRGIEEALFWLEQGARHRITADTAIHKRSSRSHSIFTITVQTKETGSNGEEKIVTGKLHMVDLAGSENVERSGADAKQASEAGAINKSLLTLGRVITLLSQKQNLNNQGTSQLQQSQGYERSITPNPGRHSSQGPIQTQISLNKESSSSNTQSLHIPYRDSPLTRLLQNSLGGNNKTTLIATINLTMNCADVTNSTLEFAKNTGNVENRPEVNQLLTKNSLIKEYETEIRKLKAQLEDMRKREGVYLSENTFKEMEKEIEEKNKILDQKRNEISETKKELLQKQTAFDELSMDHLELKSQNETLKETKDAQDQQLHALSEQYGELEQSVVRLQFDLESAQGALQTMERKLLQTQRSLNREQHKFQLVGDQLLDEAANVELLHQKIDRLNLTEAQNTAGKDSIKQKLQICIEEEQGVVREFSASHRAKLEGICVQLSEFETKSTERQRLINSAISDHSNQVGSLISWINNDLIGVITDMISKYIEKNKQEQDKYQQESEQQSTLIQHEIIQQIIQPFKALERNVYDTKLVIKQQEQQQIDSLIQVEASVIKKCIGSFAEAESRQKEADASIAKAESLVQQVHEQMRIMNEDRQSRRKENSKKFAMKAKEASEAAQKAKELADALASAVETCEDEEFQIEYEKDSDLNSQFTLLKENVQSSHSIMNKGFELIKEKINETKTQTHELIDNEQSKITNKQNNLIIQEQVINSNQKSSNLLLPDEIAKITQFRLDQLIQIERLPREKMNQLREENDDQNQFKSVIEQQLALDKEKYTNVQQSLENVSNAIQIKSQLTKSKENQNKSEEISKARKEIQQAAEEFSNYTQAISDALPVMAGEVQSAVEDSVIQTLITGNTPERQPLLQNVNKKLVEQLLTPLRETIHNVSE